MERREFLRTSCSLCLALAAGVAFSPLGSCTSTRVYRTTVSNNTITVPASLFAESDVQLVRPDGLSYDVALRRMEDGSYLALLMQCTHADNQVISTGNGYYCNLHGSRFDAAGAVTKGPAEHSLKKLKTEIVSDNVIIHFS